MVQLRQLHPLEVSCGFGGYLQGGALVSSAPTKQAMHQPNNNEFLLLGKFNSGLNGLNGFILLGRFNSGLNGLSGFLLLGRFNSGLNGLNGIPSAWEI